jgi:hypothetical protein
MAPGYAAQPLNSNPTAALMPSTIIRVLIMRRGE